jgi:hypothetical protein
MRWAALGFNLHQYPVDDYVDRIYLIGFEIKDTLDTARETTKENTWTISISTWQNCGGKKTYRNNNWQKHAIVVLLNVVTQ